MKLTEFINCYGSLSPDAFLDHFRHPFLLQVDHDGEPQEQIYVLRPLEGRAHILGRARGVHCRFDSSSVSNRHARLMPPRLDDEPWIVIDNSSSNGTFLNGKALQPQSPAALHDGDRIDLGPDVRLEFVLPASFLTTFRRLIEASGVPSQANLLDRETDQHRTDEVHPHEAPTTKARQADPESDLVVWCPPFDPVPLPPDGSVVLGRSAKVCGFVLPDSEVSRRHAEIVRRPDGLYVRDLSSANGTRIGDADVGPALTKLLCEEPIFLGPYRLCVRATGEADGRDPVTRKVPITSDTPTLPPK